MNSNVFLDTHLRRECGRERRLQRRRFAKSNCGRCAELPAPELVWPLFQFQSPTQAHMRSLLASSLQRPLCCLQPKNNEINDATRVLVENVWWVVLPSILFSWFQSPTLTHTQSPLASSLQHPLCCLQPIHGQPSKHMVSSIAQYIVFPAN